jgi:hypothetical protein
LSYLSIGVTCFFTQRTSTVADADPPFFYNLDSDDIKTISVETGGKRGAWYFNEKFDSWFFEQEKDIPANLFRWGGITQLLGGPKSQRVIKSQIDNLSDYGLDNPLMVITVGLVDGTSIVLLLGDLTPDANGHYSMVDGYPQLVLVDSTWGNIFERLVNDPPYPKWFYTMDPNRSKEILLFQGNEVVVGYGYDKKEEHWFVCDIPLLDDPCNGEKKADNEKINKFLEHFGNPLIDGAEELKLRDEEDFAKYEAGKDSPYVAIRIEKQLESGVTEVTRTTMTIGGLTPDRNFRYAVANESSDVIRIDKQWADQLLDAFKGPTFKLTDID